MTASSRRVSTRTFTVAALGFALLVACVISLAASPHPDGLEFVAASTGFLDSAADSSAAGSPFADYAAGFIGSSWLSVAVAGAVGCTLTFALAWGLGRLTRRRPESD